MKKFAILSSVLILAACGGGSGGGGAVSGPRAVVIPTNQLAVDSNSGLSMLDVNKVRSSNYAQALATVQSIENSHTINSSATVRTATRSRLSGMHRGASVNLNYAPEDMDAAYQRMVDILVDADLDGKTYHEVLEALALTGLSEEEILAVLGGDETMSLEDKIQNFITALEATEKTDEIKEIIKDATNIYQDFGKNFDVTLENAQFRGTSGGGYFKFVFDANKKVSGIEQIDDATESYDAVGNGTFKTEIKGTEYAVKINGLEVTGGNAIGDDFVVAAGETVTVQEVKDTLKNKIKGALIDSAPTPFDEDQLEDINEEFDTWFAGAEVIDYNGTCPSNATGCIYRMPVNFTDMKIIESKGSDLKLKYADFGLVVDKLIMHAGHVDFDIDTGETFLMDRDLTYLEHSVFAGGYEANKANTPDPEENNDITFNGAAYAGVTTKRNDYNDLDEYEEPKLNFYNGSATLTVSKTKDTQNNPKINQQLVADFAKEGWYTVTINDIGDNNVNNGNGTISFTDNTTESKPIESGFKVAVEDTAKNLEQARINYYGPVSPESTDNNKIIVPTEAVGYAQYVERTNPNSWTDWTYKADIAFGAKQE